MSVSVNVNMSLNVSETISGGLGALQQTGSALASQLNTVLSNQGAASTPPCTTHGYADAPMTAGSLTLNLTALPGANGVNVDGTGLRVQYAVFVNPATNANTITIVQGASNGYDGFGATFAITLASGASVMVLTNDAGSNISSTKCILTVTGTLTQVLRYKIVMG